MDNFRDGRISIILINTCTRKKLVFVLSLFKRDDTPMKKCIIDFNCTSLTGKKKEYKAVHGYFRACSRASGIVLGKRVGALEIKDSSPYICMLYILYIV